MYFLDSLDSLDHNWYCLNFYRDRGNPSWKGALTLSLFSWESQIKRWGMRTGGSWRFHTSSAPLGHKSGMSHREKKNNTYVTSTNFPYFLQNWSSCKTVIIEILQQVSVPCLPKDTVAHSVSQKMIRRIFLSSEDQTCPSFFKKPTF